MDAIYDLTIVYNQGKGKILDVVTGCWRGGGRVDMYIRRYPIDAIPNSDKELDKWLLDRWVEKEKLFEQLKQNKSFPIYVSWNCLDF